MMNILKLFLAAALIVISLNSCIHKNTRSTTSIEGLWISTEETSSQFPWAQKVALLIGRDSTKIMTVRGHFLENDKSVPEGKLISKYEWRFINVQYDTIAKRISLLDSDLDTLKCSLDAKNEILKGAFHSRDKTKKPLNFVRADENKETTRQLEIRLFYPRFPDINGKITYSYKKPEQIDDGLKTASIYDKNINSKALINLVEEIIMQKYGRMEFLLILRDNKLIVEEYFYGYDRTQTHNIHSCTKSVTSLLLGLVLDRHKNINTDQSLFSFFPQYDSLRTEDKAQISLKNVLTMTAGIQDHEGPPEKDKPDDLYRYVLSRPLKTIPGEIFRYSDESANLLGGVIYSLEGKRADEFAKEYLFDPLGIHKYFWETENGITHCYSDLHLLPRDMAKIGLLVLNEGKWQKSQIVSKEWIRESTRPHVKESQFFDYGYLWWHHSRNNLQWWKEPNTVSPKEHDLITAMGRGGQYIMIIRDLNLVIVTTASDIESNKMALCKIPMVIEEIIPIFEGTSL
jgi:hypothetical protein